MTSVWSHGQSGDPSQVSKFSIPKDKRLYIYKIVCPAFLLSFLPACLLFLPSILPSFFPLSVDLVVPNFIMMFIPETIRTPSSKVIGLQMSNPHGIYISWDIYPMRMGYIYVCVCVYPMRIYIHIFVTFLKSPLVFKNLLLLYVPSDMLFMWSVFAGILALVRECPLSPLNLHYSCIIPLSRKFLKSCFIQQ